MAWAHLIDVERRAAFLNVIEQTTPEEHAELNGVMMDFQANIDECGPRLAFELLCAVSLALLRIDAEVLDGLSW